MFSSKPVVRGKPANSHRTESTARARRTRLTLLSLESRITPVRISSPIVDKGLVSFTASVATEPASPWTELTAIPPAPEGKTSYLQLERFLPFTLNSTAMQAVLGQAPLESNVAAPDSPIIVGLPKPDGTMAHFRIVNMPMMAPELAASLPEIQTYRGQGIEDPAATLAADFTPQGFHAQVLSPDGSWYIDPYYHLDQSVYASYFRRDMDPVNAHNAGCSCETCMRAAMSLIGPSASEIDESPPEPPVALRSGTQLRTYRTVVAATGEYTIFHGGTQAAGQAAIVTAMNRVSGVYEVELSIRMTLVANNINVVYTNPNTDPYSNSSGGTMLGQNQANVDSVIGNANYDIGHVFSTGGGGVAGLGVVGITGQKARGVTGQPSPIGDPFTIDYVAHEMGHQFGGNHTFNANIGGRVASAAYEPGSGSTIMAYAGIVPGSNVQNNSDAYFHSRSFDEIISFVDNVIPGVGTRTATGNIVPVISPLTNFAIPTNTPFALTASATDGNGDTLTYNWEQRSLGVAQSLSSPDNGQSPIFRSWTGTTNPTRTFPRLSNLINNNLPLSPEGVSVEKYPALARASMPFRVTVRDNRAGGGGVQTADMSLQIVNTGAAFQVTAPNTTGITFPGGSTQTVTWNVAGTNAAPINTFFVNIRLSTDGGNTFPTILVANTANDGSESVQMPYNLGTSFARIKVEPINNVYFDFSNFNFTITNVPPPNQPQVTGVTVNNNVGAQRSMVRSLEVTFNSEVNFLNGNVAAAFQVARFGGGNLGAFTATANVVGGVTVVTLNTFGGAETQFNSLADGRYQLTVFAANVSNASGQMAANHTFGQQNGPEYLTRMFGDWNGDRQVDGVDFGPFSSTFNLSSGNPAFLDAFDVNNDLTVDGFDFSNFSGRFNTILP
jgi:hypothetical protein